MFGIRKLKEKFAELKSLVEKTVLRSQSHDSVTLGIKGQVDQLRNDMAAEFVKRDDDIVTTRTEVIKTRNAFDNALANLEKRLKNTEEYVSMQTDSIAAIILACGLREGNKFMDASEQIKREREKLSQMIAKARGKAEEGTSLKHEAPKAEPAPGRGKRLIFKPKNYIMLADLAKMIGYKDSGGMGAPWCKHNGLDYFQNCKNAPIYIDRNDADYFIKERVSREVTL